MSYRCAHTFEAEATFDTGHAEIGFSALDNELDATGHCLNPVLVCERLCTLLLDPGTTAMTKVIVMRTQLRPTPFSSTATVVSLSLLRIVAQHLAFSIPRACLL